MTAHVSSTCPQFTQLFRLALCAQLKERASELESSAQCSACTALGLSIAATHLLLPSCSSNQDCVDVHAFPSSALSLPCYCSIDNGLVGSSHAYRAKQRRLGTDFGLQSNLRLRRACLLTTPAPVSGQSSYAATTVRPHRLRALARQSSFEQKRCLSVSAFSLPTGQRHARRARLRLYNQAERGLRLDSSVR